MRGRFTVSRDQSQQQSCTRGRQVSEGQTPRPSSPGTCCPPSFLSSLLPPPAEPSEVEDFELKFTGGVPGPTSQDLLCEIKDSPWPVVLHIEATFKVRPGAGRAGLAGRAWRGGGGWMGGAARGAKGSTEPTPSDGPRVSQGPTLVISVSALQFGLLRLGQKATKSVRIQNTSPLPATWLMKESSVYLEARQEAVSWRQLTRALSERRILGWAFSGWGLGEETPPGDLCLAVAPVLPISEQGGSFLPQNFTPKQDFPVTCSAVGC